MRTKRSIRSEEPHVADISKAYERVLAGGSARSRRVEVAGRSVHLLEDGAGPPLVLLHGTTATAGMFLPLLNELHGCRAVAPDRPGHGLSDPVHLPPSGFRDAAVAWVDSLLDTLELETTALLGHSGGAMWALWYALAHPSRVTKLVLLGPPVLPNTRCPLPLRLVATPGVGRAPVAGRAHPRAKSVLQFAGAMHERETLAAHPDLVDLFVATGATRSASRAAARRFACSPPRRPCCRGPDSDAGRVYGLRSFTTSRHRRSSSGAPTNRSAVPRSPGQPPSSCRRRDSTCFRADTRRGSGTRRARRLRSRTSYLTSRTREMPPSSARSNNR